MKLIIVESPHKAVTIQKYLGKDYKIMASKGHVCDLPEREMGIDVDNNFLPKYIITADHKALINSIKDAVKNADGVYLATDPDREGEAISWHLQTVLGLPDEEIRIVFNEISKRAVLDALQHPRKIDKRLVDAQQARRVLDRLVGYNLSPLLSRKINRPKLSGGRVQSVALKMIVEREREISAFVPEEYWTLTAMLHSEGIDIKATLQDKGGKKIKITSKGQMDEVLNVVNGATYIVDSVKRGVSKSHPQPPFTTSTMTQDGSTKLNMTAPQVMQVAQKLYEGVPVEGEGQVALITYMRTDSVRIATEAQYSARNFIAGKYGDKYVPKTPNFYKSKNDAQDAHEAIRPIDVNRTPESLKGKIPTAEYRLYKLIYDRFLASQMADATYDTLNVRVSAKRGDEDYGFKVGGKTKTFAGYTAVYSNPDEEDSANMLPNIQEGDVLSLNSLKPEQKFTKPPQRYTDASLVKAMEENGIGRPSTYASILSVLSKREYTEKKDKKSISPTELGEIVCDTMQKYFVDIMDYKFTADMEVKLDKIEEGVEWQKVIADFYPGFISKLLSARNDNANYKMKDEISDVKCDKCGANMVIKEGKYGKFLACPNFPECKNIKPFDKPVGKCPICGKDLYKKTSKKGNAFVGCSGYPACNYVSWDVPAPVTCAKCGSPMRVKVVKGATQYECTKKTCQYVVLAKGGEESDED